MNSSRDDREIIATDYCLATEESPVVSERSGNKRFRTKFTADQKEKMLAFAEKLGWTLVAQFFNSLSHPIMLLEQIDGEADDELVLARQYS